MKNFLKRRGWLEILLQNSGWMIVAQGARVLEVLIRSIIVARLLSLDSFAGYAVALAFVGLITELANLNIGAVILTYGVPFRQDRQRERLNALFKASYLVALVTAIAAATVMAVLLAISYDVFIQEPELYWPIVVLGLAAAFNMLDAINKSILRLVDRFRASCMIDIVMMMVNISVLFIFLQSVPATSANAIYGAAICLFLYGFASTMVAWWVIADIAPQWWRASLLPIATQRRSMVRMAVGNSLASSTERLKRKGDILLLAALAAPNAVALYDIAKKLASLVLLVRDAVALAAFPQIAKAINAGQREKIRKLILQLFMFGVPASIFLLAVLLVLSEMFISLSFGKKYLAAGPVFIILAITSILYVLFFWATALMLNLRRVKMLLLANASGLSVMVLASLMLVPIWQITGMAWAAVLGTGVQFAIVGWVTWKDLHIKCLSADNQVSNE